MSLDANLDGLKFEIQEDTLLGTKIKVINGAASRQYQFRFSYHGCVSLVTFANVN